MGRHGMVGLSLGALLGLVVACSGAGGSVVIGDPGLDGGGDRDGSVNPPSCPAKVPRGACGLPSSTSCRYSGCISCSCGAGQWQCAAPGCALSPSALLLEVVDDATGQPLADVTFTSGGRPVVLSCDRLASGVKAPDGGGVCAQWRAPGTGTLDLVVSAPDHSPEALTVELPAPTGECCPVGGTVTRSLRLRPLTRG